MAPLMPVAVFGLEVPPGEILIPAASEFPAIVSLHLSGAFHTHHRRQWRSYGLD